LKGYNWKRNKRVYSKRNYRQNHKFLKYDFLLWRLLFKIFQDRLRNNSKSQFDLNSKGTNWRKESIGYFEKGWRGITLQGGRAKRKWELTRGERIIKIGEGLTWVIEEWE